MILAFRIALIALAAVAAACAAPTQSEPTLVPTATIKEIMDSIVDPSADVLWESVGTTISEKGVEERVPRTNEDWAILRHNAIQLIEAPNLLVMHGRAVAKAGEKSENPDVERSPAQIQMAIDADRKAWEELARGLRETALPILNAIDTKNVQQLSDANGLLDAACERCHLKYWYPDDKAAQELFELNTRK